MRKTVAQYQAIYDKAMETAKLSQKFIDLIMEAHDLQKQLLNNAGGNGVGREYDRLSSCRQGPKAQQGPRCQSCLDCAAMHRSIRDQFVAETENALEGIKEVQKYEEMSAWAQKMHKALHGGSYDRAEVRESSHEDVPMWYMGGDGQ